MKFSLTPALLLACLSGSALASPVEGRDSVMPSLEPFTPAEGSVLGKSTKRATGSFKAWTSTGNGCVGNPGYEWVNPGSGCIHFIGGAGTPKLVRRLSWGGDHCQVYVYNQAGCNANNLISTTTTGAMCWNNWSDIYSWRVVC
ncbi:hypothetical protein QBC36DRAFT_364545 [Triangularia setosa]|uniref:Uncharacterized protein n=1 Tax=Triangularia setosa TaxID=2587417 RepID=A0AAN7AAL3_9PEZI|nr:hypothetical protein QBC36DRAFT_364545 [Podospora setosa]